MADKLDKVEKMEEDFSVRVDTQLPQFRKQALEGDLDGAIQGLLAFEKQTRQAQDSMSTARLAICIVNLCFEKNEWRLLNENLILLSKRRGQLKTAIQKVVQEALSYVDKIADMPIKLALIDTLRTITEGKIFVENERARLTRILARIKEDQGNAAEAAAVLQEVQVETFGAMDKQEKTDYILEQMRLCLDQKDFVRAQIMSNKISKKVLADPAPELQELKLRFYRLMIVFHTHDANYLEICRGYLHMYDTPKIAADRALWEPLLKLVCVYVCLAPYTNEQSDLLHRVAADKNLAELPEYVELLKTFTTIELIRWTNLREIYGPELSKHAIFDAASEAAATAAAAAAAAKKKAIAEPERNLWLVLHRRVVEHNIRVLAQYYESITMKRLSELLGLPEDVTEQHISDQVVAHTIFAKIDRPAGVVMFRKRRQPNDYLDAWSRDISELLELLDSTCHLISKENVLHKIAPARSG